MEELKKSERLAKALFEKTADKEQKARMAHLDKCIKGLTAHIRYLGEIRTDLKDEKNGLPGTREPERVLHDAEQNADMLAHDLDVGSELHEPFVQHIARNPGMPETEEGAAVMLQVSRQNALSLINALKLLKDSTSQLTSEDIKRELKALRQKQ